MNINKFTDAFKQMCLFLMSNLVAILFLIGLGVIVYGFFRIGTTTGIFALGAIITLVSLVLAREGG